jgi:glyoxylase-like metal-dependent hydrolase (beta-lactamase superfamily II)
VDEPLTLVDTGPNSGKALDELHRQLSEIGHSIEDLELVILTHQHIDHLGLIEVITARSNAEVAAIDVAVDRLANFGDDAEAEDEFAGSLMISHGIPEEMVIALRSVSRSFRGWGAKADVTHPLADGEKLALGHRSFEVQHRPGHSPSDTVFWDSERSMLLCADHLIGHISSNPLVTRPLDGGTERPQALVTYLASLARTRELPAEILLPGHGEPITNHRELIDERFALHRRRAEKIERLLGDQPRTAFELAQEIWGNVAVTQAYLTLSEVLGHVDLLVNAGRVADSVDDTGIIRFRATGEGGELAIPGPANAVG